MAPATGAKESRARGARADRARREARRGIEGRAERCDDVSPPAPHEASRQPGGGPARDRGVERSVGEVTAGALDPEPAEQMTDAVRGVDETPGTDRERAGEP